MPNCRVVCVHALPPPQLPSFEAVPRKARIGILAAVTTFAIALLLATVQRCLLRCLLRYKGFLYNARKPTKLVMLWGLVMKLLIGNRKHRLYSFQGVLPSLPVPSLKDTCKRYLASVKALQTPEQFAKTEVCLWCWLCVWVCVSACVCLYECVCVVTALVLVVCECVCCDCACVCCVHECGCSFCVRLCVGVLFFMLHASFPPSPHRNLPRTSRPMRAASWSATSPSSPGMRPTT